MLEAEEPPADISLTPEEDATEEEEERNSEVVTMPLEKKKKRKASYRQLISKYFLFHDFQTLQTGGSRDNLLTGFSRDRKNMFHYIYRCRLEQP